MHSRLGLEPGLLRHASVTDINEQAAIITAWQQEYDQLSPGTFYGSIDEIWLGTTQLFLERTSLALRQTCVVWPDAFWFGLPRVTCDEVGINALNLTTDAIAVHAGGQDFELRTPQALDIFGLVVQEKDLERQARIMDCPNLVMQLRHSEAFHLSLKAKRCYCLKLSNILSIIEKMHNGLPERAATLLADELLSELVSALKISLAPARIRRSRISHKKVVSRAREHVMSHPDQLISIVDLCDTLHVSRRTLQNCFHEVLGISPITYLKALRLNGVRRALKTHECSKTVQDIAAAWGFWHMSQFAADYRQMFSELPSDTLKTALAGPRKRYDIYLNQEGKASDLTVTGTISPAGNGLPISR